MEDKSIDCNIKITNKNVGRKEAHQGLKKRHMNGINFLLKHTNNKDISILDIGAREGLFLKRLKEHKFTNLTGIDISKKAISALNSRGGMKGYVGDCHNMDMFEDNVFDLCICTHTLEHCKDPDMVVKEIHRIVKGNGLVLVEVPIEKAKSPRTSVGHFSIFKKEQDLIDLFKEGFSIIGSEVDPHPKKHWFRIIVRKNE